MVQTFEFEGVPGHVSPRAPARGEDGKTIAGTTPSSCRSRPATAMVESGMEQGVNEGFERLDELMAKLLPVA